MTYRGHVKDGQILLDDPVSLPEGVEVQIAVCDAPTEGEGLNEILLRHAGKGRDLPEDLASNHDHYAHGKPKS